MRMGKCGLIGGLSFFLIFSLISIGWAQSDDVMIDIDNHVAILSGTWGVNNTPILFYGDDFRWAPCTGSASIDREAVFSSLQVGIDVVTTGEYAVYVRWVVHPNRTVAAHYRIYDGASSIVPVGECTFNQQVRGGEWVYCDTVTLTAGNAAVVKLGNDCEASKYVIADAVRFLRVPSSGGVPSSAVTTLDGGPSDAGSSVQYSRGDHKHGIGVGAITTTHILDNTITNADISLTAAIDYSKLSGVASSTHHHDAVYVNEGQTNSITSSMIVDSAVGTDDLGNQSVTKDKLSATGGTSGQVLGTNGTNLLWQTPAFWGLTGNTGTSPSTNFIGTTDNQELRFRVNNVVAFRLLPDASSPNIIGGQSDNWITAGVYGATIGGGGQSGWNNRVTDSWGTIAGGWNNQAGDNAGTVGDRGGATVGGGAMNTASGESATVGGGAMNTASGSNATVPGGYNNLAQGGYSFAAGRRAKANYHGCFVWGDSRDADISCDTYDQWVARASGGVVFYTNNILTTGVTVSAGGGSWSSVSDRNLKENFSSVDGKVILARLSEIPIATWNYKSQAPSIRHMGPVAQDFSLAFGLGESDRHINTIDVDGVALAAIQGLYQIVKEKEEEIERIARENRELREAIREINRRLTGMLLSDPTLAEK